MLTQCPTSCSNGSRQPESEANSRGGTTAHWFQIEHAALPRTGRIEVLEHTVLDRTSTGEPEQITKFRWARGICIRLYPYLDTLHKMYAGYDVPTGSTSCEGDSQVDASEEVTLRLKLANPGTVACIKDD